MLLILPSLVKLRHGRIPCCHLPKLLRREIHCLRKNSSFLVHESLTMKSKRPLWLWLWRRKRLGVGILLFVVTALNVFFFHELLRDSHNSPPMFPDVNKPFLPSKMDPVNSGLVLEHMPVKRKLKLQEKLDQVYRETGKPFQGDLWKLSDHIPTWMNDYFEWHRDQRAKFSLDAWESADRPRVLVMQCLRQSDEKCGGTADRLKPFLFILREAAITKRLLFIHWTLPAPLEEFLLPPEHGIDWRAPAWFAPIIEDEVSSPGWKVARFKVFKKAVRGDSPFLRSRIQSIYGGAEEYDQELLPGESTFDQVYHDVWRVLFTPSPPIREIIEGYMNEWHLTPGNYAAAHLRALYARIQNRTDEEATLLTQNSLNCASKLRPGGPFFFSSDHSPSIQFALDYGKRMNVQVFARPQDFNQLPLHLDKASDILNRKPQEFYDTFVDLYLMGMSRCLTYNRGGFGTWALLLGYNSSCVHNQKTTAVRINAPCNWTTPTTSATTITQKGSELHPMPPLFIDTMPSKD